MFPILGFVSVSRRNLLQFEHKNFPVSCSFDIWLIYRQLGPISRYLAAREENFQMEGPLLLLFQPHFLNEILFLRPMRAGSSHRGNFVAFRILAVYSESEHCSCLGVLFSDVAPSTVSPFLSRERAGLAV